MYLLNSRKSLKMKIHFYLDLKKFHYIEYVLLILNYFNIYIYKYIHTWYNFFFFFK